jgi:hypothetical protein
MGDIDGTIKREVRKVVIKAMVVVCSIAALGSAITWWLMR